MPFISELFNRLHKKTLKEQKLAIGDTVIFGKYPQDGNIPTAVEWRILDIRNGEALLITKDALIASGYCKTKLHSFHELEWENSLARIVCRQFYDECFSDAERDMICDKTIAMNGFGKDCNDPVFLLTEDEVKCYLPTEEERKCKPSVNANANGARLRWTDETGEYTSWWILPECEQGGKSRMYGSDEEYSGIIFPKAVFQTGEIQYHSRNVYHSDFCIRPCIFVEVSGLFQARTDS